ncbi:MAG TPA: hypothetical protein ENN84_04665 [Candidatus Marinimicrobia bacterium]|nr:hypothetical protein [Candidatus Neomarinimicrobiota bacterium]
MLLNKYKSISGFDMKLLIPLFITVLFTVGCIDTMPLPTQSGDTYTGIQNDKDKYVEISPRWTWAELNLASLTDIYFSNDGRIYMADSAAASISVFRLSGQPENEAYAPLQNLSFENKAYKPLAVTGDSRYLVYFTDGNDKVYAWYQFLAMADVQGIITSRRYQKDGETVDISPWEKYSNPHYADFSLVPGFDLIDNNPALIDSLKSPFCFYDPADQYNRVLNPGYASPALKKSYTALAAGTAREQALYVADAANNRIVRVFLLPTVLVKLENGQTLWHYRGIYNGFIANPGTGAGTVSQPTGMVSDYSGNLYYTQLGDYFGFHKLQSGSLESAFTLGVNEIMDLDQFQAAMDIAVDADANIYVLDSALNAVKKFSPIGEFLSLIGVNETWLKVPDTTWFGNSFTVKDTLILDVKRDLLKSAAVLGAHKDLIYIGDTGNNRILRFTLADDINIDLPDD